MAKIYIKIIAYNKMNYLNDIIIKLKLTNYKCIDTMTIRRWKFVSNCRLYKCSYLWIIDYGIFY